MRKEVYEQVEIISTNDAMDFQRQINERMREHSEHSPVLNMDLERLRASVRYKVSITIPETLRDEYELDGISYYCGECPFFILPSDKRIKHIICDKGGTIKRCSAERSACDWLYEEIDAGRVKVEVKK